MTSTAAQPQLLLKLQITEKRLGRGQNKTGKMTKGLRPFFNAEQRQLRMTDKCTVLSF